MPQQPPSSGGSRKTPPSGPPPSLSEDYSDYSDFEGDSTNINQMPQPGQPQPRTSQPQMFPQGSPHLSHMGPPAMPNPLGMQTNAGHLPQTGMMQQPGMMPQ